eukprot:TRINITY_DN215_c0_g1_i1.p1 TRINITY_DN215_c0_g1~~TRINITY_DN215_c0_g1_i1.p1  ORF type:complete len:793 (-),score=229.65 TRINITY_DN215_c0_g1_i1:22-2313(-)
MSEAGSASTAAKAVDTKAVDTKAVDTKAVDTNAVADNEGAVSATPIPNVTADAPKAKATKQRSFTGSLLEPVTKALKRSKSSSGSDRPRPAVAPAASGALAASQDASHSFTSVAKLQGEDVPSNGSNGSNGAEEDAGGEKKKRTKKSSSSSSGEHKKKKKKKSSHRGDRLVRTEPVHSDDDDDDGLFEISEPDMSPRDLRADAEATAERKKEVAAAIKSLASSKGSAGAKHSPKRRSRSTEQERADEARHDAKEFQRDVRRAFQFVAAQLLALVMLYVLYVLFDMLDEVLAPLFWALLFSVLLREPKRWLLQRIQPLSTLESSMDGDSKYKVMYQKFIMLFGGVKIVLAGVLGGGLFMHLVWRLFGVPTFPYLITAIVVVSLALAAMVWLSVTSSEDYEGLAASLLVFGAIGFTLFFFVFFMFQAIVESSGFFFDVKHAVEVAVADPYWGEKLHEYGVTQDVIDEHVATGYKYAEQWVTDQGYNVTEIQEMIASFTNNDNSTELAPAGVGEALTSFDYASFDYMTIWDKINEFDFSAFGDIASMVGEYVIGAGMSILSYAGDAAAYVFSALSSALDIFVFIGGLLFFLQEDLLVDTVFDLLPVTRKQQKEVAQAMQTSINQVFIVSILICLVHGAATWVFFTIAGMPFAYSAAFLTGVIAIFPFLSEWLIFAPSLAIVYIKGSSYTLYYAIGLYIVQFGLGTVDDMIFDLIPDSHSYITALSLVLGVSTFGVPGTVCLSSFTIFFSFGSCYAGRDHGLIFFFA